MPVYNTAQFISFTLHNVVEQQFSCMPENQWELIMIDDGSTDNSVQVITSWCQRYPKSIKLICKENAGPSAARNAGLEIARGKYVIFLDSDDILYRESIPRILSILVSEEVDVVKFLFSRITNEEYEELKNHVPQADITSDNYKIMPLRDYLVETYGMSRPMIHTSTWQSIYKRSMLTNYGLKFDEALYIGEDEVFTWNAVSHAMTICYISKELFLYHLRRGSISHSQSAERELQYQMRRITFSGHMLPLLEHIKGKSIMPDEIWKNVSRNYALAYHHSIIDLIVMDYPLKDIYKAMRLYHSLGGDVHPGRPRFTPFYDSGQQPKAIKFKRFIVAYLLGFIIRLGL